MDHKREHRTPPTSKGHGGVGRQQRDLQKQQEQQLYRTRQHQHKARQTHWQAWTKIAHAHEFVTSYTIGNKDTIYHVLMMNTNDNNIPHVWKLANIIPIPKPNKDINIGTSYRPISLISVIAKTLEKVILPYITQNIPNITTQHGFKTKHSRNSITEHQQHCRNRFQPTHHTHMHYRSSIRHTYILYIYIYI